ncbi:hypothetical protein [uncultured Roseobacter sp.]|uniref:hypothetical protein n=1 Tax=uncultured Roseobacter sp. TaxID=114847 RepID=UPI00263829E4|nr:hypothetical protein [uncultured Roseobacter sp.]
MAKGTVTARASVQGSVMAERSSGFARTVRSASENPAVLAVGLVTAALAVFSIEIGDLPIAIRILFLIAIAVVLIQTGWHALKLGRRHKLPAGETLFDPFSARENWQPWPRKISSDIAQRLIDHPHKHLLLVAPTGSGKSVVLNHLLAEELKGYHVLAPLDEYDEYVFSLLRLVASASPDSSFSDELFELNQKLEADEGTHSAELLKDIGQRINSALAGTKAVFLFDQVERYLFLSERESKLDQAQFERKTKLVHRILKTLRDIDSVRTVFAVRSDHFFGSLSNLFNTKANGENIDEVIEFYFLWGINSHDDPGIFDKVSGQVYDKFGSREIADRIFGISRFASQMHADSFALRLGGYLYEVLGNRAEYHLRLNNAHDINGFVDVLLDAAYESWVATTCQIDNRALYDTVIFALAAENVSAGSACSARRVASVAHFPIDDVQGVLQYLSSIHIIQVSIKGNIQHFRLVHDRLSDRILKSEKLDIHSRGVNAMRSLTDNAFETRRLTRPQSFPRAIESTRAGFFSLSYLAVFAFVIFGLLRVIFSEEMASYFKAFYALLPDSVFFTVPDYYINPIFYLPHFIVHILWVSYIDRVNRAYIQHSTRGFPRAFARFFSLIGTSLGVFVAFLPQLFVIPIVAVGFVYGLSLMAASRQAQFSGEIKGITYGWGLRSAINVVVVLLIGLVSAPLFVDISILTQKVVTMPFSDETIYFAMIFLEAFTLYWFWQHIRGDQNNTRVWAANLALFDKGRLSNDIGDMT